MHVLFITSKNTELGITRPDLQMENWALEEGPEVLEVTHLNAWNWSQFRSDSNIHAFYCYVMLLSWAYGTTQELIYVHNTVASGIAEIRKEFDR